jgi:hypothetical protein
MTPKQFCKIIGDCQATRIDAAPDARWEVKVWVAGGDMVYALGGSAGQAWRKASERVKDQIEAYEQS